LEKINKKAKKLADLLEKVTAIPLIIVGGVMFSIVIIGTFYRYVLNSTLTWVPEMSRYFLVWLTLLGSVVALGKEEHVSVTFFYKKLPNKIKIIFDIIKYLLVGYFSYVLLTAGMKFADTTYVGTFTKIPGRITRSILPISGGLMLIISFHKLLKIIKNKN